MKIVKQILDFYINSSIHVALSCFALVKITFLLFNIPTNNAVSYFAFFGTIVGYNFVKFDALARSKKNKMSTQLKAITALSFTSFFVVVFYFFKLQNTTKIIALLFLLFTVLYTLPFFPNKKNGRNWAGLKIYIVAICWVGVTVILPVINSEVAFQYYFYLIALQRFLLIFTLILIFEIIDVKTDDPYLKTVPQQIGVKNTKALGFVLLIIFYGLGSFTSNGNFQILELLLNFIIVIISALFLYFSNENRSKYYTSFWVESVPIFWWFIYFFMK
jgi:hypothetical protein